MSITGIGGTLLDRLSGAGLEETCVMRTRTIVSDGLGGFKEAYVDGVSFDAVVIKHDTTEDRIAEKQGVKESYTVGVKKGFPLAFHDVFRRTKDGKTYRVTSNIQDKETPGFSPLDLASMNAERWDEPDA